MIDLRFSEDQRQIVNGIVSLLEEHSPVSRLRPSHQAGADVHPLLAKWGWFGIGLPEAQGGVGLGVAEEALLYLEAGRFLLSPSALATTIAARLARGELRACLLGGSERAALLIHGEDGQGYCLDRGDASCLVVCGPDDIWLASADVFRGETVDSFDDSVTIERGRLEATRIGGGEPKDRIVLLAAAMLAGIAKASCNLAVEYAKVREQFGQPIGSFQAIKHLCADMGLRAYAAEAQVKVAAAAAADAPGDARFQITAAAATAMKAARENGSAAIQVHGGIGFTAECDVHFYLKRAYLLERLLGGHDNTQRAFLTLPFPSRT